MIRKLRVSHFRTLGKSLGRPASSVGSAASRLQICPLQGAARFRFGTARSTESRRAHPLLDKTQPLSSRPIAERPEGGEAEWRDPDSLSCAMLHQGILPIHSAAFQFWHSGNLASITRSRSTLRSFAYLCGERPLFLIRAHLQNLRQGFDSCSFA